MGRVPGMTGTISPVDLRSLNRMPSGAPRPIFFATYEIANRSPRLPGRINQTNFEVEKS